MIIFTPWCIAYKISRRYSTFRDYFDSFVNFALRGIQRSTAGGRSLGCLFVFVRAVVTVAASTTSTVSHRRSGGDGGRGVQSLIIAGQSAAASLPVAAARRVRVIHVNPHVGSDSATLADMHSTASATIVLAAATAVSATVAATTADATGDADASDTDAGNRTETASTSALADVATRRWDLVGSILGGDIDMAVTLAADNRAILITGDTGGSGCGGDIVRRLQCGWPSLIDDGLHVEVVLDRRLRPWLFRSNLAASVAVRDAECSCTTAAGARAPAVRRLRR